jgi:hypothetical protein
MERLVIQVQNSFQYYKFFIFAMYDFPITQIPQAPFYVVNGRFRNLATLGDLFIAEAFLKVFDHVTKFASTTSVFVENVIYVFKSLLEH